MLRAPSLCHGLCCRLRCRKLNALDVKLHQRALELLQRRRDQQTAAGSLQALPQVTATNSTTAGKGERKAGTCLCNHHCAASRVRHADVLVDQYVREHVGQVVTSMSGSCLHSKHLPHSVWEGIYPAVDSRNMCTCQPVDTACAVTCYCCCAAGQAAH